VFDETVERFGDPTRSYRFETPERARGPVPDAVDVFAWTASPQVRLTNLATVGMCDRPMPETSHRAELHLARRGELDDAALEGTAALLANLAAYPFLTGRALDWWHTLARFGPFPGFPSCDAVLLHPSFTHGGWDRVEHEGVTIKILNVVPITADEMATARERGVGALMERVYRDEIDLLADR
jgi:hypothetical protein